MDTVRVRRELRLRSRPLELWPLVSNTDRINRALGVPAAQAAPPGEDFARESSARALGLPLRWLERPFEFSAGRYYGSVREFRNGPFRRAEGWIRLEPDGAGTRLLMEGDYEPRWPLARPLVALIARRSVDAIARLFEEFDRSLQVGPLPPPPGTRTPVDAAQLEARGRLLRALPADTQAVGRLLAHLADAPDDELRHMRPFELADRWGLPRPETLVACLYAVTSGLLELSWEALCPNCAGGQAHKSLAELRELTHCPSCRIGFSADLGESVELRFSAHPGVRRVEEKTYCVGSPIHARHAHAQAMAMPEGTALTVDLEARSYQLRFLGARGALALRPRPDAPAELELGPGDAGGERFFRPGPVALRLKAARPELARVEREDWRAAGATAAYVTSLQAFRDLFSSEVLAPGTRIGVKRVALLFTDLKGSTALYERVGDAAAYALVRDHFEYLFALIARREGAVVKTIGDAVMAVFSSPAQALDCALDMQERVGELNARLAPRPAVVLKVGVHEGPAIAINGDGRLDYFGTTANTAARVQNESEGGDVVITAAMREDPAVDEALARRGPALEEFRAELKGLSGDHRLWRLRPRLQGLGQA